MWFILRNSNLYTNRLETKQKAGWPKGSHGRHLHARDAPPVISLFGPEYINSNDGHKSALKLDKAIVAWKTQ